MDSTRIRVMVVDDSAVIRKIVTSTLLREPDIEVVGTAASGKEAIARFRELHPDVITLDIEMPEMNGIEAIGHIRAMDSRVPIIMFSTLTEAGGKATLDALSCGATDYVTKPTSSASIESSKDIIASALVGKIRVLGQKRKKSPPSLPGSSGVNPTHRPGATRGSSSTSETRHSNSRETRNALPEPIGRSLSHRDEGSRDSGSRQVSRAAPTRAPSVVLIGISTGGPNALGEVIPALPANLSVPIVIVQHMPATFTRLLAERLDTKSKLHVMEAKGGENPRAGEVYIAPGEHHLVVNTNSRGDLTLALDDSPPVNSCRPSVDTLFHSAVRLGSRVLAIVMTGMGQDGYVGARELKGVGAEIATQDEASSVVWGMPGFVTNAGLSDNVIALSAMADFISKRCAPSNGSSGFARQPRMLTPGNLVGTSGSPRGQSRELGGGKWH